MRKIFLIAMLVVSAIGMSQKVKLKKGDVLVDDAVWLKYTECGTFDSTCSLVNAAGDEIIFFKTIRLKGVEPITSSNKDGSLTYYEISFLGLNKKIEMKDFQKEIMRLIYVGKAVNEDGTLNPERVDRIVEKYGTPFPDQYNRSGSDTHTVIIKDETRKPGVQVNIGR
ncbi:hypothetical protein HUK80_04610 [Flavobacterium sp. MAH-1]|uniref:Uncharacterized protein n=1 Tax=Flavobacterium agri TaxID=2743471 RepID=A0A7Y8Y0M5_9FLAO|nr:hypothetical protein [Flavobacterium agri]NUY80167.1 hypothetical protein [Flavobacterium agri]NYA70192.1 hypothetical protein [Flavobacterium agri]